MQVRLLILPFHHYISVSNLFLFQSLTFSDKNTGCIDKNCNGIVIEVSPILLEHQIIPLMYNNQPIDCQESLNIIEERSKLPRKNFPGLTYQREQALTPDSNDTIMDANDGSTVC